MVSLLAKLLIKNYKNYSDSAVRQSYGMLTGAVGIVLNLILFGGKLFAGIITGAISITADAVNNLSDAGSSLVTMAGMRMAGRPADKEHPFGHGRLEYVSGLIVSFIILLMGYELGKDSIMKIIHPEEVTFSLLSVGILVASVLVKLYICIYNRKFGKLINSSAMKATAMDSLSDCISTAAVIIGLVVFAVFNVNIDGYVGVLVAVFILKTGIEAAKESLAPLIGQPPEKEFVDGIEKTVMEYEGVVGIHDLIVHNYGVGNNIISLHAEVPSEMGFMEAHELVDLIENDLREKYGALATVHMDPVETMNEVANEHKALVKKIISEISPSISMHDFRMTDGIKNRNLIFDVVVPYSLKISDAEIKRLISEKIKNEDENLNAVITVDKEMT
ncbi:MAG: cation transporter [Ruminiclostridium sp.]|nr:cation transporter [Ruminiclostridium sp.]MBQ8841214.1 cation transporter [Ruminiclostridium sp.]